MDVLHDVVSGEDFGSWLSAFAYECFFVVYPCLFEVVVGCEC